ncbi:hypothetical protein EsH8_I_000503 [Colletotrichum jinshuiense]
MAPREKYAVLLSSRDDVLNEASAHGVKRLIVGIAIVSVICVISVFLAVLYRARLSRLHAELDAKAHELTRISTNRDFHREEVIRLQRIKQRYVLHYGRINESGAGLERPLSNGPVPAYSPPRNGRLPEDDAVFVVGRSSEESQRGRQRARADEAEDIETDPAAPRIAVPAAVHNTTTQTTAGAALI